MNLSLLRVVLLGLVGVLLIDVCGLIMLTLLHPGQPIPDVLTTVIPVGCLTALTGLLVRPGAEGP